jgi:hypothetical protein
MVYVTYNPDGSIKSFSEDPGAALVVTDEALHSLPLDMDTFATRFMLSHKDICCYTVTARVGDPALEVNVYAPGLDSVSVAVNGIAQDVILESGRGVIKIATDKPGDFILSPADRTRFCAAGYGSISVILLP